MTFQSKPIAVYYTQTHKALVQIQTLSTIPFLLFMIY